MAKTLVGSSFIKFYHEELWFNRIVYLIAIILTGALGMFYFIEFMFQRYKSMQKQKMQMNMVDLDVVASSSPTMTPTDISVTSTHTKINGNSTKDTHTNTESKANYFKIFSHFVNISFILCTFIMDLFGLFNFFGIFNAFQSNNNIYCGYIPNIKCSLWHISKCLLYYIFILRIQQAFRDSCYAYSNCVIYSLLTFVTLFLVYAIFGDFTEIYGIWVYYSPEANHWCQFYLAIFGVIVSGLIDTFISMLCLILFIKPLLSLLRNQSISFDDQLIDTVIKYTLLTMIAIGSTAIYVILALFAEMGATAGLDGVINIVCVLLMNSNYHKYYDFICKPCHHTIKKCKVVNKSNEMVCI